ncbi:MAG: hypothetical protein A2V74_01335 [Acidobacteria bacterium RBG_16_70_10]|nr:MAG: hypothetical protein A2V74_01335 [Acidobacteria bacterium RBG_16_70_10]
MDEPALSVVLPLADHRGFAVASARAWSGQTLAAGRYEVVAVDDGRDPRRSERVHRVLRGADRLIVRPGGSEIELYQAGADAARGDVLLFTESHAVPAPDAAEALLRHFERSQAVAATLRSGHIPRHGLAKLEEWVGERVATERLATRWWAGVSLRGFSLRRRLFQELGGFRTELERFAETALAIEMDRRGLRADLAREALVTTPTAPGPASWSGRSSPWVVGAAPSSKRVPPTSSSHTSGPPASEIAPFSIPVSLASCAAPSSGRSSPPSGAAGG